MIPYLVGLDRQITARFEGKRWELPARVYGRALELFPGKVLHPDLLEKELELLHYIQQKSLQKTGEYSRDTEGFALNTRGFHFPDEKQHPRSFTLRIQNDRIAEIRDRATGEPVMLFRLEPVHIANIYPKHKEDRLLLKGSLKNNFTF